MTRIKQEVQGFAMIEAVVAAAVLAIVALGVLMGLDTAQRSSGREKARSVAAALTEQDQERLRSFRAVDLANYDETNTVEVNNVTYTIESRADWVRDATGGTQSCSNNATQADYMRVTTTTTSGLINSPIPPIKMSSLVAPPIGAFGTNQGTLGVQVNNRSGQGVPGIPVKITGPVTVTNDTNSAGCAIFAYVPVGSYVASVDELGRVDKGGNQLAKVGATVSNGTVNVKTLDYDLAASVDVTFDSKTARSGGAVVSVNGTQFSAANSGVPSGPFSPFAGLRTFDPAGSALPLIAGTGLFPFSDGYGLYGGGCTGADPTNIPALIDYYDTYPDEYIQTEPGEASTPVTLRLPSLNLKVLRNSAVLPGLTQPVRIHIISKSLPDCSERFIYGSVLPTQPSATDNNGWMIDPALPFGQYQVCAEALVPNPTLLARRSKTVTLNNYFPDGITPAPVIDLGTGTSSTPCPSS
jgi:Tfp pilus assembly protein PilV